MGGGNRVEDKGRRDKICRVSSSQNENQRGSFLLWNKDHNRTYSLRNNRKMVKIRDKK